jgi:hypothetical protein
MKERSINPQNVPSLHAALPKTNAMNVFEIDGEFSPHTFIHFFMKAKKNLTDGF